MKIENEHRNYLGFRSSDFDLTKMCASVYDLQITSLYSE